MPRRWLRGVAAAIAAHDILRVKGFAAVRGQADARRRAGASGRGWRAHFDRPFAAGEARETRLVVIGETGIDRAAVAAALGAATVPA